MTTFLSALVGLLLGAVAVGLLMQRRVSRLRDDAIRQNRDLAVRAAEAATLKSQLESELADERLHHQQELLKMEQRHEREKTEAGAQFERQLQQSLALVQEQLRGTTERLLRQRSRELDESNRTQMGAIIAPLKQTIGDMRRAMDDNRDASNRWHGTLAEQLRLMHEATRDIGQEADRLARALQSGPKVQGNFGEMKLDLLLERFGFTRGQEYDVQQTLRDAQGNALLHSDTDGRMIPDVVLHYPDHRDVIIDSKVSLTAYVNYANAENEDQRRRALNDHLSSIRRHVDELARKDYSRHADPSRSNPGYVIMFVPQEAALLLALSSDTHLWRDAFDKQVFITGEQNLFAVLRLLQTAWTQQRQTANQERVYGLASELLDRVGDFIRRFDDIGERIGRAQEAFDHARKKLDGRRSMLVPARELKRMGAKENPARPIPETEADDCAALDAPQAPSLPTT